MSNQESIAIFTHIPKASGSTLNRLIERTFSREDIYTNYSVPPKTRAEYMAEISARAKVVPRRLRAIYGHAPFGIHQAFSNPAAYITILREPVDRVISHFYYVRREPQHHLHQAVHKGELTLLGLAEKLPNLQTRYLAGRLEGVPDANDLQIAIRNAEQHYVVAGVVERFDETAAMIQWKLGWPLRPCTSENISPRNETRAVSEDDRRAIRSWNELDCKLYEVVARRFAEQVEREGEDFQAHVVALRSASAQDQGREHARSQKAGGFFTRAAQRLVRFVRK